MRYLAERPQNAWIDSFCRRNASSPMTTQVRPLCFTPRCTTLFPHPAQVLAGASSQLCCLLWVCSHLAHTFLCSAFHGRQSIRCHAKIHQKEVDGRVVKWASAVEWAEEYRGPFRKQWIQLAKDRPSFLGRLVWTLQPNTACLSCIFKLGRRLTLCEAYVGAPGLLSSLSRAQIVRFLLESSVALCVALPLTVQRPTCSCVVSRLS